MAMGRVEDIVRPNLAISLRDCLIFGAVFLLIRWLVFQQYGIRKMGHALPPSPPGLPIVGNLFSFRTDMRASLRKWTNELGGVFRLRIGPTMNIVVISDIDAIQEAFIEKADTFSERAIPPLLDVAAGCRGSLIWEKGGRWKTNRRFGNRALRSFGLGQGCFEANIIEEVSILMKTCDNFIGVPLNPKYIITNAVGNVISRLTFGFRYDYDDPVFQKLINDLSLCTSNFSMTSLGSAFPSLYHTPLYVNFRRPIEDLIGFLKDIVKDHRDSFDDALNARDIIDFYIGEVKQRREEGKRETVEEDLEWRFILDLFVAGMATTSDSLLWAILVMTQHTHIMHEIQHEIDDVIGWKRSPTMTDQDHMPITMATIMEVNRFRPVVPLGLPRFTNVEGTVKGYDIPKDTIVIMNLWEVLHSPKYWNEPEIFNPYRFLSADRKSIVKHEVFIPFGIGLRICIGERLAKMQLFIIFTSLLQMFTIRIADDGHVIDMEGKAGMTLSSNDYKIIIEKRR